MAIFKDRQEAGKAFAANLSKYADRSDVIVFALPRGGVPVGFEVAEELKVPLEVFIVRKIGTPGHPELAMGAVATGGICILNHSVIEGLRVPQELVDSAINEEFKELERREQLYRGPNSPQPQLSGRTAILIDDGLATGSTMMAAVRTAYTLAPAKVVVAVPVGAEDTCHRLAQEADEVVCLSMPEPFNSVGQWYEDFEQVSDEEVRYMLALAMNKDAA